MCGGRNRSRLGKTPFHFRNALVLFFAQTFHREEDDAPFRSHDVVALHQMIMSSDSSHKGNARKLHPEIPPFRGAPSNPCLNDRVGHPCSDYPTTSLRVCSPLLAHTQSRLHVNG